MLIGRIHSISLCSTILSAPSFASSSLLHQHQIRDDHADDRECEVEGDRRRLEQCDAEGRAGAFIAQRPSQAD